MVARDAAEAHSQYQQLFHKIIRTAFQPRKALYVMFSLQEGMDSRISRLPNVTGLLHGTVSPDDLDKFPNDLDHGISPYAFPLFTGWVDALRGAEGLKKNGEIANPFIIAAAVQDHSNQRTRGKMDPTVCSRLSGPWEISSSILRSRHRPTRVSALFFQNEHDTHQRKEKHEH